MFPKLDPTAKSNQGILKISRTDTDRKVEAKSSTPKKPIQKWTPKSRANMVARFSSLDYSSVFEKENPIPVMITLTYPGDRFINNAAISHSPPSLFRGRGKSPGPPEATPLSSEMRIYPQFKPFRGAASNVTKQIILRTRGSRQQSIPSTRLTDPQPKPLI